MLRALLVKGIESRAECEQLFVDSSVLFRWDSGELPGLFSLALEEKSSDSSEHAFQYQRHQQWTQKGEQEEVFYSMAATIVRLEENSYRQSWEEAEAVLFLPLSASSREV
ncbi:hypothetical protein NQZ68_020671 [Dissostichus eleginoides]|nr:hypothetical protein NQZ68_020671 [Dissostichus eleginoides]